MTAAEAAPGKQGRSSDTMLGIALVLAAMAVFPVMNAVAKTLSDHIGTTQLLFMRQVFYLVAIMPAVLWRTGTAALRPAQPWVQLARGVLVLMGGSLFIVAITAMPIADALAVYFVFPFVITLLSPLVLGERVGPWRWGAVLTGFLGALLVIGPGATMHPGTLLALAAGTVYAFCMLLTRRLAGADPPLVTAAISGVVGVVLTALPMPWLWEPLQRADWPALFAMGALTALGQYLVIAAHTKATAAQLAPYAYSEIAVSVAIGWALFGDFPQPVVWLGIAIVVASGIVIAWRERVRSGT